MIILAIRYIYILNTKKVYHYGRLSFYVYKNVQNDYTLQKGDWHILEREIAVLRTHKTDFNP